jgi:peptidoglycan/LPS O-acetylase OafA/YrhL
MMVYRKEIDGLRALAVLPVILFHADLPAFSGGFVGVDVFFVISGYLITSIILQEQEAGTFTLIGFYDRRARRILPALFVVTLACVPFVWLWMLPGDLKDFSLSLIGLSAFISNIVFWIKSGYFDTAAEIKPLLHTWSLAVEEQYYLLFPAFVLLIWRAGRRYLPWVLLLAALLSFAAAQWGSLHKPDASFYLLPTRGWELLIGAFAAFHLLHRNEVEAPAGKARRVLAECLGVLGVALIVYAICRFTKATPFPGVYALAPTLGTVCIILFAMPWTYTGMLLGCRPLVGIGLISYSAYLWHQPMFALARNRGIAPPAPALLLGLSALAIGLAYLSWRFVERPMRDKRRVSRAAIFRFALCFSVGFCCLGLIGYFANGFPGRFALPQTMVESFDRTPRLAECFYKPRIATREDWLCALGTRRPDPSFMVFGDSHSLAMLPTFDEAAQRLGLSGLYTGATGCAPLLGIYSLRIDQLSNDCHALNERVFNYVKDNRIAKLFLVARWTFYTDGGYDGKDFSYLGFTPNTRHEQALSREAFRTGLRTTIDAYLNIGTRLYIVAQVPEQRYDAKTVYYKAFRNDRADFADIVRGMSVSIDDNRTLQSYVTSLFDTYQPVQGLRIVSLDDLFCSEGKCLLGSENESYYFDTDHLSVVGAHRAVGDIAKYIVD